MSRELVIMEDRIMPTVEFNSNDRRIKRIITAKELEIVKTILEKNDEFALESFCSRIA